jgi:hypothetical protein
MNIIQKHCSKNECYQENQQLTSVSYLIVHTPGVYPTVIRAASGSNNWFERWNKGGLEKLTHGFIDDTGIYSFAPHTLRCWHVGNSYGNANTLGYELCELGSKDEFEKMWENATSFYAKLCLDYGLTEDKILGHYEAHKKGIASNHADPKPYFDIYKKTMDAFRKEVKKKLEAKASKTKAPAVSYAAYCQSKGMLSTVAAGKTAGTTGESKRMEGFVINCELPLEYCGHIQSSGWTSWMPNGSYCGTMLIAKRLEAIKIRLKDNSEYSVSYRAHVQGIGWTKWVKDGEVAGSTGDGRRLEAIEIKIEKR